mmetsp:Transcript_11772/g.14763  ORF Transcript_11772/g.14763 Transcript_11772/m.14763 type:complete len:246 (+) Transcript_11772:257-994(+)
MSHLFNLSQFFCQSFLLLFLLDLLLFDFFFFLGCLGRLQTLQGLTGFGFLLLHGRLTLLSQLFFSFLCLLCGLLGRFQGFCGFLLPPLEVQQLLIAFHVQLQHLHRLSNLSTSCCCLMGLCSSFSFGCFGRLELFHRHILPVHSFLHPLGGFSDCFFGLFFLLIKQLLCTFSFLKCLLAGRDFCTDLGHHLVNVASLEDLLNLGPKAYSFLLWGLLGLFFICIFGLLCFGFGFGLCLAFCFGFGL